MQLRFFIYPVFIIVCLLVFWRTIDYGFATDYLGWLNRYKSGSWTDIVTCFGYPGLHQFFHLINYIIFKITGPDIQTIGVIFILAHAHTSYLIYRTLRLWLSEIDDDRGGLISIFTSMLFALSPYCIEVLTWDACFHYIMCTALCFGSLNLLFRYINSGEVLWFALHIILWTLALFTIELALVAPGFFVVYAGLFTFNKNGFTPLKNLVIKLIPVYSLLLAGYFILTKYTIGSWVGHYGAEKHLNTDPNLLISTLVKYFSKLLLLSHHWSFAWKEKLYQTLDQPAWSWTFFLLIIFLFFYLFIFKRPELKKYILPVSFVSFIIALLPVLNLYFLWVVPYENDRYSYFAAPHFYLFMSAAFIYLLKNRYFFPYVLYITIHGILLGRMTDVTKQAGNVANGLVSNFNFYDSPEIVFLCIPENLKGAYLFRDYADSNVTFIETLDWLNDGKTYKGITHNIAQFNLTGQLDSVTVQVADSTKLKVNIASWGTWFWRKGQGLSSFENEDFKVSTGDLHFIIEDKHPEKNRLYLYTVGDQWRSIRLPKK